MPVSTVRLAVRVPRYIEIDYPEYIAAGKVIKRFVPGDRGYKALYAFDVDTNRLSPLAQRILAAAVSDNRRGALRLPTVVIQSRETQAEINHRAAVPDAVTDPATRAKLEERYQETVRIVGGDYSYYPKSQYDFGYIRHGFGAFDATQWLNDNATRIESLGDVVHIGGYPGIPYPVIY